MHPDPAPELLDRGFTDLLVADLDRRVAQLLAGRAGTLSPLAHRETTARLKSLVAAWSHPGSAHHHDDRLLPPADGLLRQLAAAQTPSGLFDSSNLASPPDTAFTVNDLCLTAELAGREEALTGIADGLREIGRRTLPPLLTGGVHTPNHRWELTSALARLDALLGHEPAVRARVEEWLAEGVDQQSDGMYSERSPLYAGAVTNPSLLVLADLLDRPDLLDPVRRNLEAFLPLLDEDGLLESVHSRRQDQHEVGHPGTAFVLPYRRFALEEDRPDFAAAARSLQRHGLDGRHGLPEVMAHPRLGLALPAGPEEWRWSGAAQLADSGLAVEASGRTRTVVFGGSDQPAVQAVRSGTANTATFLRFRHGSAVVQSLRLSSDFFGLGPFRSETLEPRDGGGYVLRQRLRAGYYQPLAAADRDPLGAYPWGTRAASTPRWPSSGVPSTPSSWTPRSRSCPARTGSRWSCVPPGPRRPSPWNCPCARMAPWKAPSSCPRTPTGSPVSAAAGPWGATSWRSARAAGTVPPSRPTTPAESSTSTCGAVTTRRGCASTSPAGPRGRCGSRCGCARRDSNPQPTG